MRGGLPSPPGGELGGRGLCGHADRQGGTACGWLLAILKRTDREPGFEVVPRRWVVERTFGWLGRCRRLSKDYEQCVEANEAFTYLAMIHLMLRRVTRYLVL